MFELGNYYSVRKHEPSGLKINLFGIIYVPIITGELIVVHKRDTALQTAVTIIIIIISTNSYKKILNIYVIIVNDINVFCSKINE